MEPTPFRSTNNPFLHTTTRRGDNPPASASGSPTQLAQPAPDMILSDQGDSSAPPFYSQGSFHGHIPAPGDEKNEQSLFPPSSISAYRDGGPSTLSDSSTSQAGSPPPFFPTPDSPQMLGSGATGFTASHYAPTPPGYSTSLITQHRDTPPPSFARPRPPNLSYEQFKPTFLIARSKTLHKGFPMTAPPGHEHLHPFITHDINEVDWLQFLSDIRVAGSLTEKDLSRSHLPIISIIPIINSLSAYGIQKYMKSRKETVVLKVIEGWNHHFFEPRKIRIILMKGSFKLSSGDERPIGDLHTPSASKVSPWTMGQEGDFKSSSLNVDSKGGNNMGHSSLLDSASGQQSKGKQKATSDQTQDETFRLFVVPI